ncbi:fatty acid--CoA ligase [Micromonospora sp. WMMD1082]|uniref:fatty acid--CoA ligase n=1 Tax=Micromonospora sp. WMMD1082 TaxID=3016104 RepID=UPI002417BD74|nr:fatty acid--CoA ligase [Micromonospora sp. WMMD1082]MDG4794573.1 fatty acid--CoA ligase [Micromonospora sp. WMMD1082]
MSTPMRTLVDVVRAHAARRADVTAVQCAGRSVSYADLQAASNRAAHAIRAAGLRRGDRIAWYGKDSEHYYELLLGIAKAGAVLVPVNWRLAADEVEHVLSDSGATLLFVDADAEATADRIAAERPGLRVVRLDRPDAPGAGFVEWIAPHPDTNPLTRVDPDDAVAQIYTSGTTGLPKGVVLAHRSFFAVREALAGAGLDWLDWHDGDRSLVCVPGFHIGGLWWVVQGLAAGITNIVMPVFTPAETVALIRAEGVTVAGMVPAMLRLVLAEPGVGSADFTAVRKVVYGGSPISEPLLAECIKTFDCDFAQIYGLTETGNTAMCLPPADHYIGSTRLQAAGRPYPGFEVAVVGEGGRRLPAGEIGEVLLRTPAAMLEYWNRPEATAQTLVDGWVHTGDAGYLDEDGYLFIRDRIKDMIIVGGENVYPAEVEAALAKHPAVAEAAVIGVPDERWGEAVHAFVVPRPGERADARELAGFLSGRLAPFKTPQQYEMVESVPRNASGKVLRRELRDRFWRGHERLVN